MNNFFKWVINNYRLRIICKVFCVFVTKSDSCLSVAQLNSQPETKAFRWGNLY